MPALRTVEVYFDYASPYAYLGTTQIERVAAEAGARLEWRPFLLGALFRAIGTPMVPLQAMPEPKRRYQAVELARWAAHWGVPYSFNTHFPLRTVDALRLTLLAPEAARAALIHRVMRAAWAEDRDVGDRDVLVRCARDVGLDHALLDRTGEAKEALIAATHEALAAGCPGAPCFVVRRGDERELFWGQDRLSFVQAALTR